ncbi:MAG TPA: hypothetical protein VIC26_03940 [Marinagarivorans sp.]
MFHQATIDKVTHKRQYHGKFPPTADGDERRIGMAPIPESIDLYLNTQQLNALQTMEYFGWELAFVRRSDLSNILPVIKHRKKGEFAVLAVDGDIIRSPDIGIRH